LWLRYGSGANLSRHSKTDTPLNHSRDGESSLTAGRPQKKKGDGELAHLRNLPVRAATPLRLPRYGLMSRSVAKAHPSSRAFWLVTPKSTRVVAGPTSLCHQLRISKCERTKQLDGNSRPCHCNVAYSALVSLRDGDVGVAASLLRQPHHAHQFGKPWVGTYGVEWKVSLGLNVCQRIELAVFCSCGRLLRQVTLAFRLELLAALRAPDRLKIYPLNQIRRDGESALFGHVLSSDATGRRRIAAAQCARWAKVRSSRKAA